jgi:predicted amidohydrolase
LRKHFQVKADTRKAQLIFRYSVGIPYVHRLGKRGIMVDLALKSTWRATCIQMRSSIASLADSQAAAWNIIEENLDRAVGLIESACNSEVVPDLVVVPEFAFQGPPHGETPEQWIDKACATIPGAITWRLQEVARSSGIFIAGNQFETDPRWPGRFFNTCFLIDRAGEVILKFRRINTAAWTSPHDLMDAYLSEVGWEGAFPVVDTELGRIAMIACGEIAVPEVARVFMMRGAEIFLHPTNEERSAGLEAAKIARAAENMAFVVSANVAGGIGFSKDGRVQGGRSHIIDYLGRSLAFEAKADQTIGVSADIDLQALREARNDVGMGNNLARARWDMYRPFYASAVGYPANQFLDAPMKDISATFPIVHSSIDALARARVIHR